MQVKLNCSRAGTNFCNERGDVIDVTAAEAGRMHFSGQCSFVNPEDKAAAYAAAGDYVKEVPLPVTGQAPPEAIGPETNPDDDDDSDAINGDGLTAPAPASALDRAKAKRK